MNKEIQEIVKIEMSLDRLLVWNGDSTPPVGTICEYKHEYENEWFKAEVLFVGDQLIVLGTEEEEVACFVDDIQFRPIKTAEQIAAEEREKTIVKIMYILAKPYDEYSEDFRRHAEFLYNEGLRFTEDK